MTQQLHTIKQVAVGAILGTVFSTSCGTWLCLRHSFPPCGCDCWLFQLWSASVQHFYCTLLNIDSKMEMTLHIDIWEFFLLFWETLFKNVLFSQIFSSQSNGVQASNRSKKDHAKENLCIAPLINCCYAGNNRIWWLNHYIGCLILSLTKNILVLQV